MKDRDNWRRRNKLDEDLFIPERSIFGIMAWAAKVYVMNFKYLALMTVIAFVPVFLLILAIPHNLTADLEYFMNAFATYGADGVQAQLPGLGVNFNAISFAISLTIILFLIFSPLMHGAATYLVSQYLKKEPANLNGMLSASIAYFPKLMVTTALVAIPLYMLLSSFNTLFMLIALYFGTTMIFYQNIVADMGRWGVSAIALSRFIVRGRWFKTCFRGITIIIAYGISLTVLEVAFLSVPLLAGNIAMQLIAFLFTHLALAIFAIILACWYFDIKRFYILPLEMMDTKKDND